ncbi:MAG: hypothetical protein SF052_26040 [Bacteroidia bacterium]|nr:hypothetical protein [Bacteroidia bacterium]
MIARTPILYSIILIIFYFNSIFCRSQVPSNSEAYSELQKFFPITLGIAVQSSYSTEVISKNNELSSLLNSLSFKKIIQTSISSDGKSTNVSLMSPGYQAYLVKEQSTENRFIFACAFAILEEVIEVIPNPDRNNTFFVRVKIKTLANTSFGADFYPPEVSTLRFEVVPSSNGWIPAPGGNGTPYLSKVNDTQYGINAYKDYLFYQAVPFKFVGTWQATSNKSEKMNIYHFEPSDHSFWFYDATQKDTIKGIYANYMYSNDFAIGYTLKPNEGKEYKLQFSEKNNGEIVFQKATSLTGDEYSRYNSDKASGWIKTVEKLETEALIGKWVSNKGYYIQFNEDRTAECYLSNNLVNYGRKGGDKINEEEVRWDGSYYVYTNPQKNYFQIVWGTKGIRSNKYIFVWQEPDEIFTQADKKLLLGLAVDFRKQ